jgi:hypothetical protein
VVVVVLVLVLVVEVVEVVVDVVEVLVVDVLVVVVIPIGIRSKFVHTPVDCTFIIVAASGTVTLYPASNEALDTPIATGTLYPSASEYMLKGPVSAPATVSVTNTVCAI